MLEQQQPMSQSLILIKIIQFIKRVIVIHYRTKANRMDIRISLSNHAKLKRIWSLIFQLWQINKRNKMCLVNYITMIENQLVMEFFGPKIIQSFKDMKILKEMML